jgi:hypothetical protein
MPQILTLGHLLFGEAGGTPRERAAYLLERGLQDLLSLLACVVAAKAASARTVPAGFTGRFQKAIADATHGGLQDFITWACARQSKETSGIPGQLIEEMQGKGWIVRLVEQRNAWQHPHEHTPEQVLEQLAAALAPPVWLHAPAVELTEQGEANWIFGRESIGLEPFALQHDAHLILPCGFEPPCRLLFPQPISHAPSSSESLWFELRILDGALDSPTAGEFHAKAERNRRPFIGDRPWWLDRIAQQGAPAFLASPAAVEGALAHLPKIWPGVSLVEVAPAPDSDVALCLAVELGLAKPPSAAELIGLATRQFPCFLAVQTRHLPGRQFLQVLYWLADLREAGLHDHLRVGIAREAEQLQSDQEKLWDRLPPRVDELLRKPRGSAQRLPDFLWPAAKAKRLRLF